MIKKMKFKNFIKKFPISNIKAYLIKFVLIWFVILIFNMFILDVNYLIRILLVAFISALLITLSESNKVFDGNISWAKIKSLAMMFFTKFFFIFFLGLISKFLILFVFNDIIDWIILLGMSLSSIEVLSIFNLNLNINIRNFNGFSLKEFFDFIRSYLSNNKMTINGISDKLDDYSKITKNVLLMESSSNGNQGGNGNQSGNSNRDGNNTWVDYTDLEGHFTDEKLAFYRRGKLRLPKGWYDGLANWRGNKELWSLNGGDNISPSNSEKGLAKWARENHSKYLLADKLNKSKECGRHDTPIMICETCLRFRD
jgi:hypothetical protein